MQIGEALCQTFNTNIYKGFLECALGRKPELFRIRTDPQTFIGQVLVYAKQQVNFSKCACNMQGASKLFSTHVPYREKL